MATRDVNDVFYLFERIVSRRNKNDPDSNSAIKLKYLNDFYAFHMNQDVHLFQLEGTLEFTVDETNTTGVYTFNDVSASFDFEYLTVSGFVNNNNLCIWHNPEEFYSRWQEFDTTKLTAGQPTDMLFYGNELVFRTIPDQAYTVRIFGYKMNSEFNQADTLPFASWVRYLAYGMARNYAQDFNFDDERKASIKAGFIREKNLLLTREHNIRKYERSIPRF